MTGEDSSNEDMVGVPSLYHIGQYYSWVAARSDDPVEARTGIVNRFAVVQWLQLEPIDGDAFFPWRCQDQITDRIVYSTTGIPFVDVEDWRVEC